MKRQLCSLENKRAERMGDYTDAKQMKDNAADIEGELGGSSAG